MRPTPAAAAMPAMLTSGSRARQSVAASRIAATLRRASARCARGAVPPVALEGIPKIPFPEQRCTSYLSSYNSYMPVQVSSGAGPDGRRSSMHDLDRRPAPREPGAGAMTTAGPRARRWPGMRRAMPSRWVALTLLASAQLMLVLDVTVVNVALPDIGAALHLDRGELPWVLTSYTLVFGGLMLLGGRIADLFGARRVTLAGLALFTASSLLCALSQDAAMLLAGRSLQGLGAALMSPAALATVMTLFTGPRRGKALGVWSGLAGVGSALGVVLGGVLTSEAGWRWVFAINVPIGIALLVAIPLVVPARAPSEAAERGLDIPGAVLVTAGTAAAIYGLINVGSHGWAAASTVLPLVLAVVIWAAFAWL